MQLTFTHLDYSIRDPVEKVAVVGDEDDGAGEVF